MNDESRDNYDLAAARILRRLAEEEAIEYVSSYGIASLTNPLSQFLFHLEQTEDRAEALADFLVDKDEVADLFATDELLEEILKAELDAVAEAAEKKKTPKTTEAVLGARNDELEARLSQDPDNIELYLVYGDWLQEQGDPLGELVARQAAVAFVPDEPEHRSAAMEYLRENQSYLVGNLADYREAVRLDWHMGFVWSAKLWTEITTAEEFQGRILLDWLLGIPTARLLRELWLGPLDHEGTEQYREMVAVLLAERRAALRVLHVGVAEFGTDIVSTDAGDLRLLPEMLPELRSLEVRAGHVELEPLNHPKLEEIALEIGNATGDTVAAAAGSKLPALEQLELSLAGHRVEAKDLKQLGPLLGAEGVPGMRRLSLRVNELADELVQVLADAPLLSQLELLDLSDGGLTDEGAELIAKHSKTFSKLSKLDVRRNRLTEDGIVALAALGPDIDASDQEFPEDDDDIEDDVDYDDVME